MFLNQNRKEFLIIDGLTIIGFLKHALAEISIRHNDPAFFTDYHIREILGQITEWMIFNYLAYASNPSNTRFILDVTRMGDAFDEMTAEDEQFLRAAIDRVSMELLHVMIDLGGVSNQPGSDLGIPYGFHELNGNDIVLRYLGD